MLYLNEAVTLSLTDCALFLCRAKKLKLKLRGTQQQTSVSSQCNSICDSHSRVAVEYHGRLPRSRTIPPNYAMYPFFITPWLYDCCFRFLLSIMRLELIAKSSFIVSMKIINKNLTSLRYMCPLSCF